MDVHVEQDLAIYYTRCFVQGTVLVGVCRSGCITRISSERVDGYEALSLLEEQLPSWFVKQGASCQKHEGNLLSSGDGNALASVHLIFGWLFCMYV